MSELAEKLEIFKSLLVTEATGRAIDPDEYRALRAELIAHPLLKDVMPRFVRTCRTREEFWQFIQPKFPKYQQRRLFLAEEFTAAFERVEGVKATPGDAMVSSTLQKFDSATIHDLWLKTLERRDTDPEGAITLARTLLESVCKHILDESKQPYEPDSDLPGLYKMTAKELNLAPSQHSQQVFKQILGGCTAVVEGLGALRNRLSDAHGQGKKPVKPKGRHAELAVNLSGAVATFLVATHQARTEQRQE